MMQRDGDSTFCGFKTGVYTYSSYLKGENKIRYSPAKETMTFKCPIYLE